MTKLKTIVLAIIIFTSIICNGCRPEKPLNLSDSSTNTYTLMFSNGRSTSSHYPLTEDLVEQYLEHLNNCPITLRMRTYKEYKNQYLSKIVKKYNKFNNVEDFAGGNVIGQHVKGWSVKGWPNHFIFVAIRENPHSMMNTYFHELGHYKCGMNKCPHCVPDKKAMPELHAILNELESAIEYDFPQVMEASFERSSSWLSSYTNYMDCQIYGDAILAIQSMPFWAEVKAYAAENDVVIPIFKKPKETNRVKIIIITSAKK